MSPYIALVIFTSCQNRMEYKSCDEKKETFWKSSRCVVYCCCSSLYGTLAYLIFDGWAWSSGLGFRFLTLLSAGFVFGCPKAISVQPLSHQAELGYGQVGQPLPVI